MQPGGGEHCGPAEPWVSYVRALLLLAIARSHLGDVDEAAGLERLADDLPGGPDDRVAGPRIRLALVRGDLGRVTNLIRATPRWLRPWGPSGGSSIST
jgi:hypothetical protein